MKGLRRRVQDQKGVALVEFALVAMLLIMLMLGMWDFGRLFDAWVVTTNAAREGARYGAISGAEQEATPGSVEGVVNPKVDAYLDNGFGTRSDIQYPVDKVTVVFPDGNGPSIGDRVQVTVKVQVEVGPLMRQFFKSVEFPDGDWATITGVATMRM